MRCRHSMPRFDYPPTRATWGARCGKSARRVLRGGTGTSDLVARLVPTHHSLSQDLLLRAVKKHAKERWIVLYIERWLKAPVQEEDGRLVPREKGTPQGGVASPLLANLFLHYALDRWLAVHYPQVPFERYADDVIAHCTTEKEAQEMRKAIAERLQTCGLELHPEKTKIVYCKDDLRKRKNYPNETFDFLGYSFQPRRSKNRKGKFFINFSPAVSNKAAKA